MSAAAAIGLSYVHDMSKLMSKTSLSDISWPRLRLKAAIPGSARQTKIS